MKKRFIYLLALIVILMNACRKEVSFEAGKNRSHGSLQIEGTGDCLPKTINGAYIASKKLAPDTNTITVDVNIITTGSYVIVSDTVNGYYFKASGVFAAPGMNTITLKGNGTPLATGINNFVISYDSSVCNIAVTVLPATAGGPATFTLASGTCSAVINGTYSLNTALTSSNTVTISVDVATIGTYTISTPATGGMTFSASGTFTTTGVQTVTLAGSGTPTTTGNNVIPVTAGTSSCGFVVNVITPAVGTLGGAPGVCTTATPAGTYSVGSLLTSGNTVLVQVSVTTAGGYSISTNTVSGFSFTASGTFPGPGVQNVTLNGSGTPTASGPQTFTVNFGSSSCTFIINVTAPPDYFPRTTNSNWSYEFDGDPNDSLFIRVKTTTITVAGNVYNDFERTDDAANGYENYASFRRSGGDYHSYRDMGTYFGFDNSIKMDYIFLKDNVPVNTSWQTTQINGLSGTSTIPIRIVFTVIQKDVPVVVNGTTYSNTIVVTEKYEINTGASWMDITDVIGYYKTYYEKNIGMIKEDYYYEDGNTNPPLDSQQNLRRKQVF